MTWRQTVEAVTAAALAEFGDAPGEVGVYVHGSIALGGWTPGQSDIDLLVVVHRAPPERLEVFAKEFAEWEGQPLELTVVEDALARTPRAAGPELVLPLAITRACGLVVRGRPVTEQFGEIPRARVRRQWVEQLETRLHVGTEHDVVLTACRALAFHEQNRFLSEQDGATWARFRLPRHAALVGRILDERQVAVRDAGFVLTWERRPGHEAHELAADVIRTLYGPDPLG